MLFDTSKIEDIRKGVSYFKKLARTKKVIEIINKPVKRSLKQNNYWHLCISFASAILGTPRQYMSEAIFKEHYNKDIFSDTFTNAKGRSFTYLKSSKDITKEQMRNALNRVIMSIPEDTNGQVILPNPDALTYEQEIYMRNTVEENKQWI